MMIKYLSVYCCVAACAMFHTPMPFLPNPVPFGTRLRIHPNALSNLDSERL